MSEEQFILGWTGCELPGGAGCMRLTDKERIENDRTVMSNYWLEQINLYGQRVDYYVNTYNTLSADNLYGEQPLAAFHTPKPIIVGIDLQDTVAILSKYGFRSDEELTVVVHFSSFRQTFDGDDIFDALNQPVEPKSGDLIQLTEFGSDRPYDRTGRIFQITDRTDEDVARINPLAGHYVWFLRAKRYEFSYEPNAPQEGGNAQVYDNNFAGLTSESQQLSSDGKVYTYDVDTDSKENVFDQTIDGHDDVYGGYA